MYDKVVSGPTGSGRVAAYIEKLCAEFFPEGVPNTSQSNKPPCDAELPLLVTNALVLTDTPDPALPRKYHNKP